MTRAPAAPIAAPGSFSATGAAPLPDRWWEDFGDAELNRLIEETVNGNFQLAAAWARLRQAEAIAKAAGSGRFPQLDLNASASRRKVFNQFASLDPSGMTPSSFEVDNFGVSAVAGYELDIWRRMSNQAQAAAIDAQGARGDIESLAMSLAAEVAETWFDLLYQRSQRALLERQILLNQDVFDVVTLRFEGGLASAVELLQQKQQLIATRARLVGLDSTEAVLRQRLAVLTGKPPLTAVSANEALALPGLPPLPSVGVPADLLVRRPDVRAARDRVVAADYRVAVAVADRLPSIRIGASLDFQDTSVVDLLKTPLWSLFASLAAPLFDGFRRKAEVERQRAVVSERLATYAQVLLTAIAEVEAALVSEREQLRFIVQLEEQQSVAEQNLATARSRYEQGVGAAGFLDVLGALQSVQSVELNLLASKRTLISYRIRLCRALGGRWTKDLASPALLTPQETAPAEKNQ